jgi:hypothetical protein
LENVGVSVPENMSRIEPFNVFFGRILIGMKENIALIFVMNCEAQLMMAFNVAEAR